MKLSEVFSSLTYGELSQLNLGGAETGAIDAANYAQVLSHVNLGLTALYSRFTLKEGRLTFALEAGRSIYPMSSDEDVSFVYETGADDFSDDILKIESLFTDDAYAIGLNDKSDVYSFFTQSDIVLRAPLDLVNKAADLPEELLTDNVLVTYRAAHPRIVYNGATFNPASVYLELPYTHLEPLLFFVASRVHNPVGMTNEFHAGNSYAAKYEKACQMLELKNLQIDQGSQNSRFESKGFV